MKPMVRKNDDGWIVDCPCSSQPIAWQVAQAAYRWVAGSQAEAFDRAEEHVAEHATRAFSAVTS